MDGPLHVRTREEWASLIHEAHESGDPAALEDAARQAFDDWSSDEAFNAWIVGVCFEDQLPAAADLVPRFLERHPASLHPVQVDFAEMLISSGELDGGSNEARAYLRRIAAKNFEDLHGGSEHIVHSVPRAFLMMTSVYTEVGARSYSLRALRFALRLDFEDYWRQRLEQEIATIVGELAKPGVEALDAQWETFFQRGEGVQALLELCKQCRVPILAHRIAVLDRMFCEQDDFSLADEELFQLVYQTDKGALVLY